MLEKLRPAVRESGHTDLDARVQLQARSLTLHRRHVDLLGVPVHFASEAASRVRPLIGDAAYRHARKIHRRAASARHDWQPAPSSCDSSASSRSSPGSPSCSSAVPLCSAERSGPIHRTHVRDLQKEVESSFFNLYEDEEQDSYFHDLPEPAMLLDMVTEAALGQLLSSTRSRILELDHQFDDIFCALDPHAGHGEIYLGSTSEPNSASIDRDDHHILRLTDNIDDLVNQLQDEVAISYALNQPSCIERFELPAAADKSMLALTSTSATSQEPDPENQQSYSEVHRAAPLDVAALVSAASDMIDKKLSKFRLDLSQACESHIKPSLYSLTRS